MKIDEAIKLLGNPPTHTFDQLSPDYCRAIMLGVEALEEIDYLHITQVLGEDELLPGETE